MSSAHDVFGDQRAALRWDTVNQQVQLKFAQAFSTFRDLTVKYKGDIDFKTGELNHTCHIGRPLSTNQPFIQDFLPMVRYYEGKVEARDSGRAREEEGSELIETADLEDNVKRILPGGLRALFLEDFALIPGVTLSNTRNDKLRYTLKLQKLPQYVKHFNRTDTFLEFKGRADIEPVTKEVALKLSPRVSIFRYNITQSQNLKATIGCDFSSDLTAPFTQALYVNVTDSRWDLKFKKNRWQFTYNLQ